MNFEDYLLQLKSEGQKCQKCGRQIKEGEGNICRHCLIEMSDGSLRKDDFDGTKKAQQPKNTPNKKPETQLR